VDVELERKENAIIVPRDAVFSEEKTFSVRVVDGGDVRERPITLGSMSDHEAVVTSGLEPGVTVQRHVAR
jgi:multidrug efflux pump subunit AcrA (membrane-fusion protein)